MLSLSRFQHLYLAEQRGDLAQPDLNLHAGEEFFVKLAALAAHHNLSPGQRKGDKGLVFVGDNRVPPLFIPLLAEEQELPVARALALHLSDRIRAGRKQRQLGVQFLLGKARRARAQIGNDLRLVQQVGLPPDGRGKSRVGGEPQAGMPSGLGFQRGRG